MAIKDVCARCNRKWPKQTRLDVQDLMTKLMNGETLTTEQLMTLQGFDTQIGTPNLLEYCLLCKHQFTQTLNWSQFPKEVIN